MKQEKATYSKPLAFLPIKMYGQRMNQRAIIRLGSPPNDESIFEKEVFEDELLDRQRKRQTVLTN